MGARSRPDDIEKRAPSLTVVIPTFQRPAWLARAVKSLAVQDPAPYEVVAVARETDSPTRNAIAELRTHGLPFPLREGLVSEPGFMPPVREGFRLAGGDIVAVMDDDAEAEPGWVQRLLVHYSNERVGGVGGRCINMQGERVVDVPCTDRVGYVSVVGSFVGNMYKTPTFSAPVEVEFLQGGCMSYRRSIAQALEFDPHLNRNVAFGYEIDLGLQVRALGWRLVFDPSIAIRHYSAPRDIVGTRDPDDRDSVHWYAYNETRVALRRLRRAHAGIALIWKVIIGERRAPGLVPWVLAPAAKLFGYRNAVARAAISGRIAALREVFSVIMRSHGP